jgi:hypothetical protein
MCRLSSVVVVALLLPFGNLRAQDLTQSREFPEEPSLTWPILEGALVGLGGWVAGGVVGATSAGDSCGHEFCELEGFIYGAAAGGTVGLALGTHLGNRRRGSFPLDVLSGAAVWFASLGVYHAMGHDLGETASAAVWVVEPVAQFITTVVVERATGRARDRRHAPQLSVIPRRDGVAIGVSLSF